MKYKTTAKALRESAGIYQKRGQFDIASHYRRIYNTL